MRSPLSRFFKRIRESSHSEKRWTLIVSVFCSGGLLGAFQATFLFWRYSVMQNAPLLRWLAGVGIVLGVVTMALLIPAVVLLRRWHFAWRREDRWQATWSTSLGLAAAIATWMVADVLAGGPLVPEAAGIWLEIGAPVVGLLLASRLPPPRLRWIRLGAAFTPLGMLLVAVPPGSPGRSEAQEARQPGYQETAAAADVILVTVDTLRADCMGQIGQSPSLMPALDRIAAEGVLFRRALAPAPWTVPSLASLMTGMPAVQHQAGSRVGSGLAYLRSPLASDFTTLAERFAAAGYQTRAVVANVFLSAEMGMDQGFEEMRNPLIELVRAGMMRDLPLTRLVLLLTSLESWGDPRARGITDLALAWLEEAEDRPLFLWVHYIDPHSPFEADPDRLEPINLLELDALPSPGADGSVIGESFSAVHQVRSGMLWLSEADRSRLKDYYHRGVRYVDAELGRLFDGIRKRSQNRKVVVAFTADHGEELWDHGGFEHGHDYYREVTHVPLFFWEPGGSLPEGTVIDQVVGLVDVGPTLLTLAGLEAAAPEAPDQGRSLIPAWTASETDDWPPLPRFSGGNLYDLPAVLVEEGPWRYVLRANQTQELYHVIDDPGERHNAAIEHPAVAQRFREMLEPRLRAFLEQESAEEQQELSPEVREGLRSLGYLQ